MSMLPARISTRLVIVGLLALAVVVAVVLALTLPDGDVPAPTDGIGDLPTAHLVPDDAALYAALRTDLESTAWSAAFALLERLGADDPLGQLRAGVEGENGISWDEEIDPFLGVVAAFVLPAPAGGEGEAGAAVLVRVADAAQAEAILLREIDGGFEERAYRDAPYKLMEGGGILAVIGGHLVLADDEPTLRAIVDASLGETRPLADSDDFRRIRNQLDGEALGFLYLVPDALLAGELREVLVEGEPNILAALGLDDFVARPLGMVVRADGDTWRLQAVTLGDPGAIAALLRPRESRFVAMVPAETAIFASTSDLGGLVDDFFRRSTFTELLRTAGLEALGGGEIEPIRDLLLLLDGEAAFAAWTPDGSDRTEAAFLAEADDADRAAALIGDLLGDAISAGDLAVLVGEGVIAIGTSDEAVETVLSGSAPALADSERYAATVARLESPLASFLYIDIPRLFGEADGDILGLIVNLVGEDGRAQAEAALAVAE